MFSLAKKTMFKMAFHGGLTSLWGGLMAIPEVTVTSSYTGQSLLYSRRERSSSA